MKLRRGKKKRRCQNRENAIMDERMRTGGINAKGPLPGLRWWLLLMRGALQRCERRAVEGIAA